MSYQMSNKRDLIQMLEALLVPHGYVRSKDDWYFPHGDVICVIGLGKSSYGGQFCLALALLLPELAPELVPFPPYHLCHFRGFDVRFLVPDEETLKEALNLENNLPAATRAKAITTAVIEFALPFLAQLNSKHAIAQQIKSDKDFEPFCDLQLKLYLESKGYLNQEDLKLDR